MPTALAHLLSNTPLLAIIIAGIWVIYRRMERLEIRLAQLEVKLDMVYAMTKRNGSHHETTH